MVSNWVRFAKVKKKSGIRIALRRIEKNRGLRLEMIGCILRYYHFISILVHEKEGALKTCKFLRRNCQIELDVRLNYRQS